MLFDFEKFGDMKISDFFREMRQMNAATANYVFYQDDKEIAAIVVIQGEDVPRRIKALNEAFAALDKEDDGG